MFCLCLASGAGTVQNAFATLSDGISHVVTAEPKILDFGQVNESERQIELSFTLTNASRSDITIVNVRSGCGCTSVRLPSSTLKAGASVVVPVNVNISGRRGTFVENVRIEIAGHAEQIVVPIRGTVIHDLWFEQPVISFAVKESETSVERVFEIHTIDHPNVQFNLELHEESLSIRELERTKNEGQTTIKFLLNVSNIPLGQSRSSYRLVLMPTDPNIRPLVIPVMCYRSLRLSDARTLGRQTPEGEYLPPLSPERASLGVMRVGTDRKFQISSDRDLLCAIRIGETRGFPKNVTVEILPDIQPDNTRTVVVRLGEANVSGVMEGAIDFVFANGQIRSVIAVGIVIGTPSTR